jgi:hypothetical protein
VSFGRSKQCKKPLGADTTPANVISDIYSDLKIILFEDERGGGKWND